MMSRPAPHTARSPTAGPAPPPASSKAPTAPSTSIADVQLHIRRNAEEYRQVLDDLADWESHIKTAPSNASSSTRSLPPVRGSTSAASAPAAQPKPAPAPAEPAKPPKSKTPRDYSAWDKMDVNSLLQEMENQDYADFHAHPSPSAQPAPTTTPRNPQLALIEKDTGNVYFKKAKYAKALKHYSKAIELDPLNPVLYLNRAAAYLKLDPPIHAEAAEDCTRALDLDHGKNVKALFRRAMAKKVGGDATSAIDDLKRAQVLEPTNMDVKRELLLLDPPKPVVSETVPPPLSTLAPPQAKVPKRRKLAVREFSSAPVDHEPVGVKDKGEHEELMTAVKTTAIAADQGESLSPSRPRARSRQTTAEDTPMPDAPLMLASSPPPEPESEPEPESVPELLATVAAAPDPAPVDTPAPTAQTDTPVAPAPAPAPSTPAMSSLPVPHAAYEFTMAMSHLTRHGHLPRTGQRTAASVANVSDTARAYLLAIPPKHLMALFATAGVDTEAIGWVVVILRSMPPATDPKSAALKYNYVHYLSQCARFSVARRLLAKVYVDMMAEVVDEIRGVFVSEGKMEAVDKVDKVGRVWGV